MKSTLSIAPFHYNGWACNVMDDGWGRNNDKGLNRLAAKALPGSGEGRLYILMADNTVSTIYSTKQK